MPVSRKGRKSPATVFSFVGNTGCIRFSEHIRKGSGIKRGDRLAVSVKGRGFIELLKLDLLGEEAARARLRTQVAGCSCQSPPEQCKSNPRDVVTVGWSYVHLQEALALELGFKAGAGIKLVAQPSTIQVFLHEDASDLKGVSSVVCPP